jgi:uncharacterized protein YyaL (SSP411 family)
MKSTAMKLLVLLAATLLLSVRGFAADANYASKANEVMQYIQQNLYNQRSGSYFTAIGKRQGDFMWGNGITFSALVAASRYQPEIYQPVMNRFFASMDRYWDAKAPIPGYEPAPTNGNGHDKYYDDNEWMVITFAEAYAVTRDQKYLIRANDTLKFSLSGWDDELGGGIWWREAEHKGKNTCSNGPGATACVRMAAYLPPAEAKRQIIAAQKIVAWTDEHLADKTGLYYDNESAGSEHIGKGKLTYNTALMIRAKLGLYRWTHDEKYLQQAKQSESAGDWFVDSKTGAYRDAFKWSHLMVEADLETYRLTHDQHLLDRAKANADYAYQQFKSNPPKEEIDLAAIARTLWLLADTQTDQGKRFWAGVDKAMGSR